MEIKQRTRWSPRTSPPSNRWRSRRMLTAHLPTDKAAMGDSGVDLASMIFCWSLVMSSFRQAGSYHSHWVRTTPLHHVELCNRRGGPRTTTLGRSKATCSNLSRVRWHCWQAIIFSYCQWLRWMSSSLNIIFEKQSWPETTHTLTSNE